MLQTKPAAQLPAFHTILIIRGIQPKKNKLKKTESTEKQALLIRNAFFYRDFPGHAPGLIDKITTEILRMATVYNRAFKNKKK